MNENDLCPCASGEKFGACCGPILSGAAKASTAQALMRARYSAYATGNVDFLYTSSGPDARRDFDREECLNWSRSAEWNGLEINGISGGGENDDSGTVEFTARYSVQGREYVHREKAKFERDGGEWIFIDGEIEGHVPLHRATPKIGRNDPCPCGSGKKYKKCCGRDAR